MSRDLKADYRELWSLLNESWEDWNDFKIAHGEHWLERAIAEKERADKYEALVREFVEVAEMLLQWWNNGYICQDCPNPSGPARTCTSECCSILDDYRQAEKKLIRAKEVLGDD